MEKYTQQQRSQILAYRNEGFTYPQIAEKVGIPFSSSIWRICKTEYKKHYVQGDEKELIIELRKSGLTYKDIAKRVGRSVGCCREICISSGVTEQAQIEKDQRFAEYREYKAQGHTIKETAEHFGVSKATISKVCKGVATQHQYNELSRLFRLSDEEVRQRLETANPGFLYVGGYSNWKCRCEMKCLKCGATLIRRYDNLIKGQCRCDNCFQEQVQETAERNAKIAREKERNREILQAEREERRILKEQERAERIITRKCAVCHKEFDTMRKNQICCSDECRKVYSNKRHDTRIPYAKRNNAINARALMKRDNGVCWICGGLCNLNDYVISNGVFIAGDWYPSVDHLKPICDGGEDTWVNVKLAHRCCNTRRYFAEKTSPRSLIVPKKAQAGDVPKKNISRPTKNNAKSCGNT